MKSKSIPKTIRLSSSECVALNKQAMKAGVSLHKWLRESLLAQLDPEYKNPAAFRLLRSCAKEALELDQKQEGVLLTPKLRKQLRTLVGGQNGQ
jgi:hypothetical protein